ncbi:hypothetical protein C8Q69DRAFT_482681 [Paecilomyces variotii]|uniref:Uncharacterized protein n=1 Tax=Byssochlamys spectabilis TaxID=264951 RepID=A0A443HI17_BYSSP|nr:hypothetical protein C8Q69DRAFT_482681 [Paecilomyces variotii]RWQ91481.1 hypothetical protein C8Q69DRAFT_482681 [Paecilomyces variotii]
MTALNETMRAVVWQGQPFNISVLDVPKPIIMNQTDAIVRMSRAAICGSDLHIYRGTMEGQVLPVGRSCMPGRVSMYSNMAVNRILVPLRQLRVSQLVYIDYLIGWFTVNK